MNITYLYHLSKININNNTLKTSNSQAYLDFIGKKW
nr:MAG TPA: hypothetical protein [Caudoviricetes sp.]